jgi:hypothetical protein
MHYVVTFMHFITPQKKKKNEPLFLIREHHENHTRNRANNRWQHRELAKSSWWTQTPDRSTPQFFDPKAPKRQTQPEKGVDKVRKPELIRRQVHVLRLRRRPKTLSCCNPVVCDTVISNVAICEGRKEARQTAESNKNGGEVLVDGVAVAIVCSVGLQFMSTTYLSFSGLDIYLCHTF